MHIALGLSVGRTRPPKLIYHIKANPDRFVSVMGVDFRKAKQRHDAFRIGGLNITARASEKVRGAADEILGDFSELRRFAFVREIVFVRDIADYDRCFIRLRLRIEWNVAGNYALELVFR